MLALERYRERQRQLKAKNEPKTRLQEERKADKCKKQKGQNQGQSLLVKRPRDSCELLVSTTAAKAPGKSIVLSQLISVEEFSGIARKRTRKAKEDSEDWEVTEKADEPFVFGASELAVV